MDSQPIVFESTVSNDRLLNTFEASPKISLEFPRLVPMPLSIRKTLSKRMYPSTIFDLSYNYQLRNDFDRSITEFAYSWKYNEGKSQVFQIKWQSSAITLTVHQVKISFISVPLAAIFGCLALPFFF